MRWISTRSDKGTASYGGQNSNGENGNRWVCIFDWLAILDLRLLGVRRDLFLLLAGTRFATFAEKVHDTLCWA